MALPMSTATGSRNGIFWMSLTKCEKSSASDSPVTRPIWRFDPGWSGNPARVCMSAADYTSAKNQDLYAQCNLNYYRNAINMLRERVPGTQIFAFSDDPDWVASQLLPEFEGIEIVRHNTGSRSANDMKLMSTADHHIIANSSFSWWGAWLNAKPNKLVIAPKPWFLNKTIDDDLIPSTWVRI